MTALTWYMDLAVGARWLKVSDACWVLAGQDGQYVARFTGDLPAQVREATDLPGDLARLSSRPQP